LAWLNVAQETESGQDEKQVEYLNLSAGL